MIHLLEVSPGLDIAALKKLSRKLAMTGGYELALKEGLGADELSALAKMHIPEVAKITKRDSTYFTNNSYRILELLIKNELLPSEARILVEQIIQL